MSYAGADSAFFTRALRVGRDDNNPHSKSHTRAEVLRGLKRSLRRDEVRSKWRHTNTQQVQEILSEFGLNPEEPHDMIEFHDQQEPTATASKREKISDLERNH